MADTNLQQLVFKKESTYGTVAAGNGFVVPHTSHSLKHGNEDKKSSLIRNDRQISDVARVGISADGAVESELLYGAFDTLIESAVMGGAFAGAVTVSGTNISAAAADNSLNSASSAFGSITAGSFVKVSGFSTNGALFIAKVASSPAPTSAKIVLTGITLVNESAGPSVSVKQGDKISNGTTLDWYSIEEQFSDLASKFLQWVGCGIGGLRLGLNSKSIVTIGFDLVGKKQLNVTSTGMGTPTAAPSNSVYNTLDHPWKFWEGGIAPANEVSVTELTLALANNLRRRDKTLGLLGAASLGAGECGLTGTLGAYFADFTLLDKFLNFTTSSAAFSIKDGANQTYVFEIPAIKYTQGGVPVRGPNDDLMVDLNWSAFRDATSGKTLIVHRIA